MKQFFLDLLSGKENTPGSKRFTSLWGLLLFTLIVIFHLISKTNVQEAIVWGTLTLILVPLGYNAVMGIKALTAKSQVASDIVKEDASSENTDAAKDVLQNDKPKE